MNPEITKCMMRMIENLIKISVSQHQYDIHGKIEDRFKDDLTEAKRLLGLFDED